MKTWVRRSLNAGALTAGALLVSGAAAQASPVMTTTDNAGLLNGTQALIPVQVPISVCGNAVAVAGAAKAECEGGATALSPEWLFGTESTMTSQDNVGLLNGTQAAVPVQVPIDVCGNAVAVLGAAAASCDGGATAGPELPDPGYGYDTFQVDLAEATTEATMKSTSNNGVLNGTQVLAPIQVPIDICGNAVGVLGVALAQCEGGASANG